MLNNEFIIQITIKGVYNARFQIEVIKYANFLQCNIKYVRMSVCVKLNTSYLCHYYKWNKFFSQLIFLKLSYYGSQRSFKFEN